MRDGALVLYLRSQGILVARVTSSRSRPTRARACWRHNFHSFPFDRAIEGAAAHGFTFQVNTPGDGAPLFSRARSSERANQGSSVRILRSASSQSSRS